MVILSDSDYPHPKPARFHSRSPKIMIPFPRFETFFSDRRMYRDFSHFALLQLVPILWGKEKQQGKKAATYLY